MADECTSVIKMVEKVNNTERRFGSAKEYFPVWIEADGKKQPAMFTLHELRQAIERAQTNPEDMPEEAKSFFFSWFR